MLAAGLLLLPVAGVLLVADLLLLLVAGVLALDLSLLLVDGIGASSSEISSTTTRDFLSTGWFFCGVTGFGVDFLNNIKIMIFILKRLR